MKHLLKLSIAGNIVLTTTVLWLGLERSTRSIYPGVAGAEVKQVVFSAQPDRQAAAAAPPAPFRWSQIESTDYLVYIANLRSIGCPEQTVRDLISAEVDALYAPRRERLQREPPSNAQPRVDSRLELLQKEEAEVLERLLHPETIIQIAGAATAGSGQGLGQELDEIQLPLFMNHPGPGFELTDEQLEAVDQVQLWFQKEIGGPNQDPRDPEYLNRWQKARPRADGMLMGLLGMEAWVRYGNSLPQREP